MTNVTKCIWSALLLKWYSINKKTNTFKFYTFVSVLHIFYLLMRILDQPLWLKSKKMFVLGHIETVLSVTCFFFLLLLFLFSFCDETVVMEFKRDTAIVTRTVCVSIWYHFRKCGEHVQMPRMQGFVKLLWVHRLVTISIVFLCVSKRRRHETEVRSVLNGCNDYTWDNEFPTVPECYNVVL